MNQAPIPTQSSNVTDISLLTAASVHDLNIPPHNIADEQAILGACLIDNEAFDKVATLLSADSFYRHDHRVIFSAYAALRADEKPIDLIIVERYLMENKANPKADKSLLEDIGGFAYLIEINRTTFTAANVLIYAQQVKSDYDKRQLLVVADKARCLVYENRSADAEDLIQEAEKLIFDLSDRTATSEVKSESFKSAMSATFRNMQLRSKKSEGDRLLGISTGSTQLNTMTKGFAAGDLIIIAGRPSMGKSAYAGCCESAAFTQGVPTLCFSMEMPTEQITQRQLARLTRIPLNKIKGSWDLDDNDWVHLTKGVNDFNDAPYYIIDAPALSPSQIRSEARRINRKCRKEHGKPLGLITVDYIQLMAKDGIANNNDTRANEVSEFSSSLKALAKDMNLPVIALSQLNRSVENRLDKHPVMSDLRDSGAIEQDADMIIFLYRDEVYNKDDKTNKGHAELIVAKQRNGEIGDIPMLWEGQYQSFKDRIIDNTNYGENL